MSLSLSRNTVSKIRERGLSEYITLREDIALKDPLGEVPAQKAAASKITKRMSALMSRPTASKQKQQKEQFQEALGMGSTTQYRGKPLSPSEQLSRKMVTIIRALQDKQKRMIEATKSQGDIA